MRKKYYVTRDKENILRTGYYLWTDKPDKNYLKNDDIIFENAFSICAELEDFVLEVFKEIISLPEPGEMVSFIIDTSEYENNSSSLLSSCNFSSTKKHK